MAVLVRILVPVWLVCLIHGGVESSNDRYVSFSGKDNPSCTNPDNPCFNLDHALNISTDSDSIFIDGSNLLHTYSLHNVNITQSLILRSWKKNKAIVGCVNDHNDDDTDRCSVGAVAKDMDLTIQELVMHQCRICFRGHSIIALRSDFILSSFEVTATDSSVVNLQESLLNNTNMDLVNKCQDSDKSTCSDTMIELTLLNSVMVDHGCGISTKGNITTLHISIHQSMIADSYSGISISGYKNLDLHMDSSLLRSFNTSSHCFAIVSGENATTVVQISGSVFSVNHCYLGGALHINSRNSKKVQASIETSNFIKNTGNFAGSSIQLDLDDPSRTQTIRIDNCSFSENENSESAAGVYVGGGTVDIFASYFDNNHVTTQRTKVSAFPKRKGSGGGVYVNQTAVVKFDHCKFWNNTANWFGGTIAGAGNVTITNSVFENSPFGVHATLGDILFLMGPATIGNLTFNVVTTESNLALIWYSSESNLETTVNSYVDFVCPIGAQFRNDSLPVPDHRYIAYKDLFYYCDPCEDNKYSLQRGYRTGSLGYMDGNISQKFECEDCVYGAECRNGQIGARLNFWGYTDGNPPAVNLIACPDGYCCPNEVCDSYDNCAANRTGTLCGECEHGMSEMLFSPDCVPNHKCHDRWYIFIDLLLSVLYLLFFLYQMEIAFFILKYIFWMETMRDEDALAVSGFIKTIFYFYQMVDLLTVQANQAELQLGVALQPIISYILSFKPFGAFFGVCPYPGLNPVTKQIVGISQTLYMFAIIAIMGAIYFAVTLYKRKYKRRRPKAHKEESKKEEASPDEKEIETSTSSESDVSADFYINNGASSHQDIASLENVDDSKLAGGYATTGFRSRLATTYVSLFLYNYTGIANMAFILITCVEVRGRYVLFYDGNVQCMQAWQYIFIILAVVHVIPFFLVVILSRHLLETNMIGLTQFFASWLVPLPFLFHWGFVWAYRKYKEWRRHEDIERTALFHRRNSYILVDDPITKQVKHDILYVVEEPFLDPKNPEESASYWEGVLIFRRLVLSILAVAVTDALLTLTLQTLFCLSFLLWHLHKKPYASKYANHFETMSLTLLTVIAVSHLIQATLFTAGKPAEGPIQTQIYVTDWIEFVCTNLLPFLLGVAIVVSVVVRVGYVVVWAVKTLYRKIFRTLI